MSDSEREFALLLRAAFKKTFESQDSISAELVQEQGLFAGQPVNAVRSLLASCCNVLRQAGYEGELRQDMFKKTKVKGDGRAATGVYITRHSLALFSSS